VFFFFSFFFFFGFVFDIVAVFARVSESAPAMFGEEVANLDFVIASIIFGLLLLRLAVAEFTGLALSALSILPKPADNILSAFGWNDDCGWPGIVFLALPIVIATERFGKSPSVDFFSGVLNAAVYAIDKELKRSIGVVRFFSKSPVMGNICTQVFVVLYGFIEQEFLSFEVWYLFHAFEYHIPRVHEALKVAMVNLTTLQINEVVQRVRSPTCRVMS
jgi:hypothetical protein